MFEGGFLGLDNIGKLPPYPRNPALRPRDNSNVCVGLFNRSDPLPTGGQLEQADSTGWMAFYSLSMLNIALELAKHRRIYEDSRSSGPLHEASLAYRLQSPPNSLNTSL